MASLQDGPSILRTQNLEDFNLHDADTELMTRQDICETYHIKNLLNMF